MSSGFPDWYRPTFIAAKNVEQVKASATATDSTHSFTQQVKSLLVYNDGPYAVHINFDAAATTNHLKIPSGAGFYIDIPVTDVHLICASGETASCYLIGIW